MIRGRTRRGVAAAVLVVSACHHRDPVDAPLPTLPGEPPQVQVPVGSTPITDQPPVTPATSAPDPQLRRFDVVSVEDTTFTILIGPDRWVRRGTIGIAVDPARRDALVARFRILSRLGDSATALVTGQTTRVSATHVALIREPVPGPLQQEAFWTGLFLGVAAGAAAILVFKH